MPTHATCAALTLGQGSGAVEQAGSLAAEGTTGLRSRADKAVVLRSSRRGPAVVLVVTALEELLNLSRPPMGIAPRSLESSL